MCGLVGLAGALEYKDEDVLKRLLVFDSFRGMDSTGLAAVRKDGEVLIAKVPSHPFDLFEHGKFKTALSGTQSKLFLGHNRLATKGKVNTFNAHPFEFDHIVGCHNGTLDYQSFEKLKKALGEDFPVDSMAVIKGLAVLGVDETLAMMNGSWSLTWYDSEKNTLNLLRNKERPMWYGYSKDFKTLGWASEWPFMRAAWTTAKSPKEIYMDEKGHSFWHTSEDVLYSFDLEALAKTTEKYKPKCREVKGAPTTNFTQGYGGQKNTVDPFQRRLPANQDGQTGMKAGGQKNSTTHYPSNGNVISLPNANMKFDGRINKDQFLHYTKEGCSFCGKPVTWEMDNVTLWERDGIVLGPCCSRPRDVGNRRPHLYAVLTN
jgi:predicted glutamine amidotransferase